MRFSLVITLMYTAGLACAIPIVRYEDDDPSMTYMNEDKSQQDSIVNIRGYHKTYSITQLFDAVLKNQGGMDTGNNGNSNGDDGSHKPPSKRSLTADQASILQWHQTKVAISELSNLNWSQKAADVAQFRLKECSLGEKESYNEHIAIGHTSWNDVLNAWWDEMDKDDSFKKVLLQSIDLKKGFSVGCAMQTCPHGQHYACNYVLPSGDFAKIF